MKIKFIFPVFDHKIGDTVDLEPTKAQGFISSGHAVPFDSKADQAAAKEYDNRKIVTVDPSKPTGEESISENSEVQTPEDKK